MINLDVPSNVVHKKRVARILFIKIRPSQEILKIRDGTSLETEEILTYIKSPQNRSVWHFSSNLDVPSNEVQKKRVAEEILIYIKKPSNKSVWHFSSNLDVPTNVVQKKRVARILFFKIRPSQEILKIRDGTPLTSQEILKIRDGTPLETEEILIYIKKPSNKSVWHFSSNLDVPINVVQKKRVARILFFKIRPSQEILKIRHGTPLETEEILTYIKSPQNRSFWHFYSNLDVPNNVVHKKRVARILFIKIRPSQEILKIRDGTSLETEEILTYIKSPQNRSVWHFSSNLDVPSNEVQKKRVAQIFNLDVPTNVVQRKRVAHILFFKIRPSQEILKIRDGTPMEAEEILIYIKKPSNKSVWHFSSKLDILSNVVQKKRVARILFFKIRPSQEILKIRHGTPLETEEILTYIKSPQNRSFWHFYSNLDVPSNVVHKKRVARILFIKIRPSQEILKIRDGTSLETEEILTYIKSPQNRSVFDVPTNVVQRKRVAHILFFKIRPSQEILKIRDGTPMEAEEILIYIKSPQNKSVWHFSSNLDVPSNVVQKKRVARIMFFKIRPSQEIQKIRDVQKKIVARILFFKIRPSQEILKIRDGTPLEAEEILIYIKRPSNKSVWHFSSNLDVPINVVQKKRVARILFFKIRPSQEILKIRDVHKRRVARNLFIKIRPSQEILKIHDGTYIFGDGGNLDIHKKALKTDRFALIEIGWHFSSNLDVPINVVQKKRVARILFFQIRLSQEILKIRHGTPLETEEILTYIKSPQNRSFWHFYSNLDVPSNVVHKKRVARNLFIKIRPSQEILKIRDGTSLEMEEILTYIKKPSKQIVHKKRVARNLFIKIRSSQEILKIRDGTLLEAEEILIYIKKPSNQSVWHFSSNLDVPTNVVQRKRVAQILGADSVFKIRTSQEILKIRDVARILFFKIRPSQEILKIRDGTPLEAEEILIYIKKPSNKSVWHFSSKLDILSNVVQKKRVARILFFKIRPSQEILKIRHGTPLETEEILTYIKSPQNRSFWHFYSNLDVPSNVVHKKRVARNLFIKIRPSQEILKIRDGTSLEMEEILTYIKSPQNRSVWPSQEILKICHGTPLETEEILTYIKSPQNRSFWQFYSNLDVPSNVVQKKRVARILFFKIRPSQEILKIRDDFVFKIRPSQEILKIQILKICHGTPLETEEILTYIKSPQNRSFWQFYSNLDVPSNVVQKKRVARILFFKIRPSQEILKIRDDTEEKSGADFVFKIRPSQEILKIRDDTPLETEEILTYIKSPQNRSVWHFFSNLDVPSNEVQKKRVARILFFILGHLKKF
ncbi:hypothetical protein OROMI_001638 [Orobanche minor]